MAQAYNPINTHTITHRSMQFGSALHTNKI